jgi:hypothetical protein
MPKFALADPYLPGTLPPLVLIFRCRSGLVEPYGRCATQLAS